MIRELIQASADSKKVVATDGMSALKYVPQGKLATALRRAYSMGKTNCWEFMKCGREYGGIRAPELGVCPAAAEKGLEGIHRGRNAGRSCWVVAGTFCGGEIQGSFAKKYRNCGRCNFYIKVRMEEGVNFRMPTVLLHMRESRIIDGKTLQPWKPVLSSEATDY